jgi:hypothetical protein
VAERQADPRISGGGREGHAVVHEAELGRVRLRCTLSFKV